MTSKAEESKLDKLDVNPNIKNASTIDSRVYTDPAIFEQSKESLFARSWQFVGDTDLIKVPGQVYPFTLLEGCLDEPLLLARDTDDSAHCLSNVCTHRGNLVCEHPGVERGLRCRYHGRRFGLDGSFQSMPEFEEADGFPSESDNLPRISFAYWKQFLFVSLEPTFPLGDLIREMNARVGWMPFEEFRFDPGRSRDYLVKANWALYCDNYLEGFHVPFVHSSLASVLDYGSYRTELFPYSNVQVGVAAVPEDTFDLPPSSPDYGQHIAAYYFWLYPNSMFNFYPWGVSVNVVKPISVDLTRVSFLTYLREGGRTDAGAGGGVERVEREDEAVVESVQKGVRSRFYDRGRYSPVREQGVHHFHRLLAESFAAKSAQG
jgi:choline monooxygenase